MRKLPLAALIAMGVGTTAAPATAQVINSDKVFAGAATFTMSGGSRINFDIKGETATFIFNWGTFAISVAGQSNSSNWLLNLLIDHDGPGASDFELLVGLNFGAGLNTVTPSFVDLGTTDFFRVELYELRGIASAPAALSTPGPIAGAALPALLLAGGFAVWRRRRVGAS